MQSGSDTLLGHSRRGWRSPSRFAQRLRGEAVPGAGRAGVLADTQGSESGLPQERPDGFTSDTRHSCREVGALQVRAVTAAVACLVEQRGQRDGCHVRANMRYS